MSIDLREELDERMEQAKKLSYKIKQDLKAMLVSINQQKANLSRNPSDKRLETTIRIQTGQVNIEIIIFFLKNFFVNINFD